MATLPCTALAPFALINTLLNRPAPHVHSTLQSPLRGLPGIFGSRQGPCYTQGREATQTVRICDQQMPDKSGPVARQAATRLRQPLSIRNEKHPGFKDSRVLI